MKKALVAALPRSAAAQTYLPPYDRSASYDIQDNEQYGNRRVWSQVDMFTDDESHHLRCMESTFTDQTSIGVTLWEAERNLTVYLS